MLQSSAGSEYLTDTGLLAGVGMSSYSSHPLARAIYVARGRIRSLDRAASRYTRRTRLSPPDRYYEDRDKLESALSAVCAPRLVYKHIIGTPLSVKEVMDGFGAADAHVNEVFGVAGRRHSPSQSGNDDDAVLCGSWLERLRKGDVKARQSSVAFRIAAECAWAHSQGRFLIFDTVTIDEKHARFVKANSGKLLAQFIRRYKLGVAKAVYGSLRQYKKAMARARVSGEVLPELVSHCRVSEYGGKNGRLHWHFVLTLHALPKGSRDPNFGRVIRNHREIAACKGFWKYGWNSPIAVRYQGDAYTAKLGWEGVMRRKYGKNGKVGWEYRPLGSPYALSAYMSKYLRKAFEDDGFLDRGVFNSRTSFSRNFGVRQLREVVECAGDRELEAMCVVRKVPRDWKCGIRVVPIRLLRRFAVREWFARRLREGTSSVAVVRSVLLCPYRPNLLTAMREYMLQCRKHGGAPCPVEFHRYYEVLCGGVVREVSPDMLDRVGALFAPHVRRMSRLSGAIRGVPVGRNSVPTDRITGAILNDGAAVDAARQGRLVGRVPPACRGLVREARRGK